MIIIVRRRRRSGRYIHAPLFLGYFDELVSQSIRLAESVVCRSQKCVFVVVEVE